MPNLASSYCDYKPVCYPRKQSTCIRTHSGDSCVIKLGSVFCQSGIPAVMGHGSLARATAMLVPFASEIVTVAVEDVPAAMPAPFFTPTLTTI